MKLSFNNFAGEFPRIDATKLPVGSAQIADNCDTTSGSLNSFKKSVERQTLVNTDPVSTIFLYRKFDGTQFWLEWTQDVDVVAGPIAGDVSRRMYFTGTDEPRVFDQTQVDAGSGAYPQTSFKLSVPAPVGAPIAVLGAGGSGVARNVVYVYTFVRKWASGAEDESAQSPPSNTVSAMHGQEVTLSAFDTPPSGHGITHIRQYRASTGDFEFIPPTLLIEDCEDAWNEFVDGDVTSTAEGTIKKVGDNSVKLDVAAGASANDILATEAFSAKDLRDFDRVQFWIRSSVNTVAGDLKLLLDNTASCASPVLTLDVPALTADIWKLCEVDYDNTTSGLNAIISVGLKYAVDVGACNIYIDDIRVARNTDLLVTATSYIDTAQDTDLDGVLKTENWDAPPADLHSLRVLPNGVAVGLSKNQVCFSVPYQIHAWPEAYRRTLPYDGVGLGNVKNTVVVGTTANVFEIDGQDPAALSDSDLGLFPCLSKKGIISTEVGVFFPSHRGTVLVNGGRAILFTEKHFSDNQWALLYPSTIKAVPYQNKYFAAFNNEGNSGVSNDGFFFNYSEPNSGIIGLFGGVQAMTVDAISGKLYYASKSASGNSIWEWNASEERMGSLWRSPKIILSEDGNLSVARILAKFSSALTPTQQASYTAMRNGIIAVNQAALATNRSGALGGSSLCAVELDGDNLQAIPPSIDELFGMTFKLYANDVLRLSKAVTRSSPFRLPGGYRGQTVEIELQSTLEIDKVILASSAEELYA